MLCILKTKILIIRFSSIGDIVLTSPVVRCLKNQLDNAEIHFLTKSKHADLVEANPYIDKIHLYESNLQDVIPQLQEEKFDYIVDLHHNIRTQVVKSNLKAKSFSLNKINIRKWLLVTLKMNVVPEVHIVDRLLMTVSALGIKNDYQGLDFFIPENEEYDIEKLPEEFRQSYVAIALSGTYLTKRLPSEKHLEYMSLIDVPYILIGGKAERQIAEDITEKSTGKVLNLCNRLSINESASIVKNAQLVITNDTGLMHIAAAFKKKILSLWGSTTPNLGMYPYLPHPDSKMQQVSGLRCQPCTKIGKHQCPKTHFKCMLQQDSKSIAEWIQQNFKE